MHSFLISAFLLPYPAVHKEVTSPLKIFALQLTSAHFKVAASVTFFLENPRELLTSKLSKTKSFEYFPINLRLTLAFCFQCSQYLNNWISSLCPSCLAFGSIKDLSNSFPRDHSGFKTERPFSAKFTYTLLFQAVSFSSRDQRSLAAAQIPGRYQRGVSMARFSHTSNEGKDNTVESLPGCILLSVSQHNIQRKVMLP